MPQKNFRDAKEHEIKYDASGNRINDYVPAYITKRPWYYNSEALKDNSNSRKRNLIEELEKETTKERFKHQRIDPDAEILPNNLPKKGKGIVDHVETAKTLEDQSGVSKEKEMTGGSIEKNRKQPFRSHIQSSGKVICKNCGSRRHRTRDCLEKPKKIRFKFRTHSNGGQTNADGFLVRMDTNNYDEKRDRWHGYDPSKDYSGQLEQMEQKAKTLEDKYKSDLENQEDHKTNTFEEDEIEEMLDLGLVDDVEELRRKNSDDKGSSTLLMQHNPLALDNGARVPVRSLDDKPQYLKVIKTGEELRFNPKSRVYKDLKKGYLNGRGQFVPYLNGEAAQFEKMKTFTHGVQKNREEKWENGEIESVTDLHFAAEASPTAVMLAAKKKEKEVSEMREKRRKELLLKYGALD